MRYDSFQSFLERHFTHPICDMRHLLQPNWSGVEKSAGKCRPVCRNDCTTMYFAALAPQSTTPAVAAPRFLFASPPLPILVAGFTIVSELLTIPSSPSQTVGVAAATCGVVLSSIASQQGIVRPDLTSASASSCCWIVVNIEMQLSQLTGCG